MKAKTSTRLLTLALPACLALALTLAGCGGGSTNCLDQRYATIAWTIEEVGTRAPLDCRAANAVEVDLNFGTYAYAYDCTAYQGTTDVPLPVGSYLTSIQLVDANGVVLSDTNTLNGPTYYPINSCSPDDIPTVIFSVQ
jgi:hypothetical protein